MRHVAAALMLSLALGADAQELNPARQQTLIRMVRQDCGACHGMRLTGGLGPALTPEALAGKPLDAMASTIAQGRPGTPMPPWRAMLSDTDVRWIVEQLAHGFPDEARAAR